MRKTIVLVAAVGLISMLQAADISYTDAGADHLWSNSANWSGGVIPNDSSTGAAFKTQGTVVQITDGINAVSKGFMLGMYGVSNSAEISGGSLTSQWLDVGRCNQNGGDGLLTMTGGVVNVTAKLSVANVFATYVDPLKTASGQLNLWGGEIYCSQLQVGPGAGITGLDGGYGNIDIRNDGKLVLTQSLGSETPAAFEARIMGYNITGYGDHSMAIFDFDYITQIDPDTGQEIFLTGIATMTAVPEPATLTLLLLGSFVLHRKK